TLTVAAPPPVQRALEAVAVGAVGGVDEGSAESTPDIDELSEKIWRKLEDRIRVEKERQFGLP
ncbi:MAG TPA: hypothetical protein PKD27_05880, partial [Tepidiformaceae bacterium]|nr:hypothetical protein [Tepidiformaceae bacterium]